MGWDRGGNEVRSLEILVAELSTLLPFAAYSLGLTVLLLLARVALWRRLRAGSGRAALPDSQSELELVTVSAFAQGEWTLDPAAEPAAEPAPEPDGTVRQEADEPGDAVQLSPGEEARPVAFSSQVTLPSLQTRSMRQPEDLRPAELAYLARNGDVSGALIVLSLDLLHRAAKAGIGEARSVQLAPYEAKVWQDVKDFSRRWAKKQVDKVVQGNGEAGGKSGAGLISAYRRLSGFYSFVVKPLRAFVKDIVSDPRHLRRYFTPAGILRLAADLGAADYKDALERQLEHYLVAHGLVVPEASRHRYSAYALGLALLGAAVVVALAVWQLPDLKLAVAAAVLSGMVAAGLRAAFSAREFLPFYLELKHIADSIDRRSWRLAVLRFVLGYLAVATYMLMALLGLIFFGLGTLFIHALFATGAAQSAVILLSLTIAWVAVVQLGLDSWSLRLHPHPTLKGLELIAKEKARLADASPLKAFGAVLVSADYDPLFSKLVAIYGPETLLIFA